MVRHVRCKWKWAFEHQEEAVIANKIVRWDQYSHLMETTTLRGDTEQGSSGYWNVGTNGICYAMTVKCI